MCQLVNNNIVSLRYEVSTLHTAANTTSLLDFPISIELSNGNPVKVKSVTGYIKNKNGAIASSPRYVNDDNTFFTIDFNFKTFSGNEQKVIIPKINIFDTGVILTSSDLGNVNIVTNKFQQKFTLDKALEVQNCVIQVNAQIRANTDATLLTVINTLYIMIELE